MQKRGQVSTFIIVGLILALVIGLVFLITSTKNKISSPTDSLSLKKGFSEKTINSCLDDLSLLTLINIGQKGGFLYTPKDYLFYEDNSIGISYLQGKDNLPTLTQIEQDAEKFIKESFILCSGLAPKELNVDIKFSEDTLFLVEYVVEGKIKETNIKINSIYEQRYEVNLKRVHNDVKTYIKMLLNNNEAVDSKTLLSLKTKTNLEALGNKNFVVFFIDEESTLENNPYTFLLGVRIK
ncbi:MAG: hypothetical protein HYS32_04125 [Candidatus Woesearchaeota archaeon]|nr:MAG: hypothetical protein HYS32_04125 [Candidatus Woesearchaeota archaeon]